MQIRHLKQTSKNNCGQTVAAILSGKTVKEAEKACGTRGCTTTKILSNGFAALGWMTDWQLTPWKFMNRAKTRFVVLRVAIRPGRSHWVLWDRDEDKIYDPALKRKLDKRKWEARLDKLKDTQGGDFRVTSWMGVRGMEDET